MNAKMHTNCANAAAVDVDVLQKSAARGGSIAWRERGERGGQRERVCAWGHCLLLLLARHARRRFCFSCGACRELIKFTRCTFPPRLDAGHAPCLPLRIPFWFSWENLLPNAIYFCVFYCSSTKCLPPTLLTLLDLTP